MQKSILVSVILLGVIPVTGCKRITEDIDPAQRRNNRAYGLVHTHQCSLKHVIPGSDEYDSSYEKVEHKRAFEIWECEDIKGPGLDGAFYVEVGN